ncbi:PREDICTED: uncharacterized protein LOC104730564 isoform X2 [Camelina sativa]|uniref:Uncharacterized protein LOC104730564 isoform X2 n=1 Tax=Camelina sativa TaxID=90675 RepID=A0ABM0UY73_CAMSA|nr:PREDICTED: uncharacterized protein LOC104730564 isoform X2 [Camelina sativa]
MVKPRVLLCPGGPGPGRDTPEKKPPPASTEDPNRERVYGSDTMVKEGDLVESDITEKDSEGFFKIIDQIEEKASSIFKFSLLFDDVSDSMEKEEEERLRVVEAREKEIGLLEESISGRLSVLEEKEIDSDLRQVIMMLVLEKQSEARDKELNLIEEAIKEKTADLKRKEETFELKMKEEAERWREENELRSKGLEVKEKELRVLEEAMKEKTTELKRKEETFELKVLRESEKLREETELSSKILEIKEKALGKMLNELAWKQMELEETSKQQVIEAESRKRSNLELEPLLLVNNNDSAALTPQAKKQKSHEANDEDIEVVITDEVPKSLTCHDTDDFSKLMSSFAVDQVWALYDSRDDMPRIYAKIRSIFDSELSLQVTLLEPVKTTKDRKFISSGCGRFEYGDTEIKSHLMFAHEMHHIICANNVIVNPREGETWALFRDWNASWNLHEPPYRYDFVRVISEFDDLTGIRVAYMGRVASDINSAEHGVIIPGEMQRFSHKVASVKSSGDEKEGIPAGSFKEATPRYDPEVEEVVEMRIQSKGCGKAPRVEDQNGSRKDLPIILD